MANERQEDLSSRQESERRAVALLAEIDQVEKAIQDKMTELVAAQVHLSLVKATRS